MNNNNNKKATEQRKSSKRKKSNFPCSHSLEFQAESVYTYVTCKPYNDLASRTIKDQEKVRSAKAI